MMMMMKTNNFRTIVTFQIFPFDNNYLFPQLYGFKELIIILSKLLSPQVIIFNANNLRIYGFN